MIFFLRGVCCLVAYFLQCLVVWMFDCFMEPSGCLILNCLIVWISFPVAELSNIYLIDIDMGVSVDYSSLYSASLRTSDLLYTEGLLSVMNDAWLF